MRRRSVVAALVLASMTPAGAVALDSTSTSRSSVAAQRGPASISAQTAGADARATRLSVRFSNCRSCKVALVLTRNRSASVTGYQKPRNGRAHFRVGSSADSVAFLVQSPRQDDFGSIPVASARYRGEPVGSSVSRKESARARFASGCWAGSNKARATIRLRVAFFHAKDPYTGETGTDMRVWSPRTLRKVGPYTRTIGQGTLGTQDPTATCR